MKTSQRKSINTHLICGILLIEKLFVIITTSISSLMFYCLQMCLRKTCLKHYNLDPAHYYTSPGLAWDACLKETGQKLELLHDDDMLMLFERGIRGGITHISKRYRYLLSPIFITTFQLMLEKHLIRVIILKNMSQV